LVGLIDFDWVDGLDVRKPTAGYVFSLGYRLVTWDSKKQSALALSSTKAEYRVTVRASQEAMWLCQSLFEFGFQSSIRLHSCATIRVPFGSPKI
jgi:hypothetical protein